MLVFHWSCASHAWCLLFPCLAPLLIAITILYHSRLVYWYLVRVRTNTIPAAAGSGLSPWNRKETSPARAQSITCIAFIGGKPATTKIPYVTSILGSHWNVWSVLSREFFWILATIVHTSSTTHDRIILNRGVYFQHWLQSCFGDANTLTHDKTTKNGRKPQGWTDLTGLGGGTESMCWFILTASTGSNSINQSFAHPNLAQPADRSTVIHYALLVARVEQLAITTSSYSSYLARVSTWNIYSIRQRVPYPAACTAAPMVKRTKLKQIQTDHRGSNCTIVTFP